MPLTVPLECQFSTAFDTRETPVIEPGVSHARQRRPCQLHLPWGIGFPPGEKVPPGNRLIPDGNAHYPVDRRRQTSHSLLQDSRCAAGVDELSLTFAKLIEQKTGLAERPNSHLRILATRQCFACWN